jgi:hypothetical protein
VPPAPLACATPTIPSHGSASVAVAEATLAAMYSVVIGRDEHGSFPMLRLDEDELPGGAVRWRLVGQTDDYPETVALLNGAHDRCYGVRPQP